MYVVAIQFGNGTQVVNSSCHKQSTGLQRLNCLNAFSHIYCQHYTIMVIGGVLISLNLIHVAGDGQKTKVNTLAIRHIGTCEFNRFV